MNISAHLLAACLLLTAVIVVVMAEPGLRRRVRAFRPLQWLVIGSGMVLIPLNIYCTMRGHPNDLVHTLTLLASAAALLAMVVHCFESWVPAGRSANPRRVLAIGAHPDDLELACGGTLARLADAGHEIHALVMSEGTNGGDASVRPGEAIRGARLLGLDDCTVLSFSDGELAADMAEMIRAIEAKITTLNPDIIFTHSSHDIHQDHVAVHQATLRAGRRHPAILCYESPSVTTDFIPQVFVDIDDHVDAKIGAISMHRDQAGKPYMAEAGVTAMAGHRGAQGRLRRAEGFEAVRIAGFRGVL